MTDLREDIEAYTCGEVPSPLVLSGAPRLENWYAVVLARGKNFVMALCGDAHNRPGFDEGSRIQTSEIVWFDRKCRFIRTVNTLYRLGDPQVKG